MFENTVDIYDDDITFLRKATTSPEEVKEHLSFMLSEAKRKTEVSLRSLFADERRLMEEAKDKEVDQ